MKLCDGRCVEFNAYECIDYIKRLVKSSHKNLYRIFLSKINTLMTNNKHSIYRNEQGFLCAHFYGIEITLDLSKGMYIIKSDSILYAYFVIKSFAAIDNENYSEIYKTIYDNKDEINALKRYCEEKCALNINPSTTVDYNEFIRLLDTTFKISFINRCCDKLNDAIDCDDETYSKYYKSAFAKALLEFISKKEWYCFFQKVTDSSLITLFDEIDMSPINTSNQIETFVYKLLSYVDSRIDLYKSKIDQCIEEQIELLCPSSRQKMIFDDKYYMFKITPDIDIYTQNLILSHIKKNKFCEGCKIEGSVFIIPFAEGVFKTFKKNMLSQFINDIDDKTAYSAINAEILADTTLEIKQEIKKDPYSYFKVCESGDFEIRYDTKYLFLLDMLFKDCFNPSIIGNEEDNLALHSLKLKNKFLKIIKKSNII